MNFTIEKNIPLPKRVRGKVYPFREMEVGDSFNIKIITSKNDLPQKQRVYVAIWRFRKSNPDTKFTTSSTKDCIRVWRLK